MKRSRGNPKFTSKWENLPTVAIRVPKVFVNELLEIARHLDTAKAEQDKKKASITLSGRQLAKRLGVGEATIRRRKNDSTFSQWARGLDPEGKSWIKDDSGFKSF